jgi:hypothetical protein
LFTMEYDKRRDKGKGVEDCQVKEEWSADWKDADQPQSGVDEARMGAWKRRCSL